MSRRVVDRRIIGEEREFVLSLGSDDVAGNGQRVPFRTGDDRHRRPVLGLQKLDSCLECDPVHGGLLRPLRRNTKTKGATSAKRRPGIRPATGQVNEEHAGYSG